MPGKSLLDCAADVRGGIQQSPVNVEKVDRKFRNGRLMQAPGAPLQRDPAAGARRLRGESPVVCGLPNPSVCC